MTFGWDLPYSSQRMPVMAGNIVATSQPLAVQAGLATLERGGNAVDAAVAAAVALTVVEPTMNGIGGDAFAIVWDGRAVHGLNASGRSPAAWNFDRFAHLEAMPVVGWDAVTVPGAVSAWVELSDRFGRLPFGELFRPALDYARKGFLVSPVTADVWAAAPAKYAAFPEFKASFLIDGRAPLPGECFICPGQADSLELIAHTKGEAFYRGDLARRLVAHARNAGGLIAEEDLAAHRADWVELLSADYHDITLHEMPPNGQGIAALLAVGILDSWNIREYPIDSVMSVHLQIEAMKLAFADAHRYVADRSSMNIDPRDLLTPSYLASRAQQIDVDRAQEFATEVPTGDDTVYLTTADEGGMMVSMIQSNYFDFGSGIVVPGTGISLHSRAAGFSVSADHPNRVDGGKRPFHTIIPAFVTRAGEPVMSFGVMGGPMQPQGHVQLAVRIFDYGQNPQAACDAPRWQVLSPAEVALEPGFDPDVVEGLKARGHRIAAPAPGRSFGGAQVIYKLAGGYCGASDPRKDGQASGF
ncbi:MAG: gamma-glutamyltransferase family protein [Chloroflexota bacterium]